MKTLGSVGFIMLAMGVTALIVDRLSGGVITEGQRKTAGIGSLAGAGLFFLSKVIK